MRVTFLFLLVCVAASLAMHIRYKLFMNSHITKLIYINLNVSDEPEPSWVEPWLELKDFQ